tara:strand:- start:27334 stop:27981 length:648 start_codon:yes stop_codon:yes gene_type:complete
MNNSPAQGTSEWLAIRRALFTGSEIENICKPKGLGTTGETYIFDKVAEMLTPIEFDTHFENDATRWGNEHEPTGVYVHEKRSDSKAEEIGFQVHHAYQFLGASPDRKVYRGGKVGVLEVKCPYEGKNHIKHMMIDSVEYFKAEFPKYYWQTVCEFICTPDVTFVDFVSFDPRMAKKYRYFCFTFTPSQEDCEFLIKRAIEAETKRQEIIQRINKA